MSTLSPAAIVALDAAGITPAQWIAFGGWLEQITDADGGTRWVPSDQWRGDVCGCTDDRCTGYHHGENEPCGCLPALIAERAQKREAHALWAEYRAAAEAHDGQGDHVAHDAARTRAEAWVRRYYPGALTFSLDAPVKGQRGISVTYPGTDPGYVGSAAEGDGWRMLVWSADVDENGRTTAPAEVQR
ncbi:hypothetical protein ACWFNE_20205 [Cellulomonas sp. NPDC055163]